MNACRFCKAVCCKEHVITVTSFDIAKIMRKTGKKFEEFAELEPLRILNYDNNTVLECYERKMRYDYILELKSQPCIFLENDKCKIHGFAPLVCSLYPHNSAGKMHKGARCPLVSNALFRIKGADRKLNRYRKQILDYKKLVAKWNRKKGSKKACIKFLLKESR